MDKLIEILAGKRIATILILLFISVALLPSVFLVFVWNRELFYILDLWKLLLLSTCIGIMFGIFNFLVVSFVDSIIVALTGRANEIYRRGEDNEEDRGMQYTFYYMMAIFFVWIEVIF